jgi:hypothetical protein
MKFMRCPACGDDVPEGKKTCGNCGASLEDLENIEPSQEEESIEDVPDKAEPTEEVDEEAEPEEIVEDEALPDEVVEAPEGTTDVELPSEDDETEDNSPLPADTMAVKQETQVPPDEYGFISLGDLAKRSRITGKLTEADGNLFDYFIVDVDGYEAMSNGDEAESLDEAFDSPKYRIDLDIEEGGKYYLVLENRSESEPITVEVDLRIRSR